MTEKLFTGTLNHNQKKKEKEKHHEKTCLWGFQTRSDTNQVVLPIEDIAKGLKFWIWEVEGLYYLRSENEGDQAADLLLF